MCILSASLVLLAMTVPSSSWQDGKIGVLVCKIHLLGQVDIVTCAGEKLSRCQMLSLEFQTDR